MDNFINAGYVNVADNEEYKQHIVKMDDQMTKLLANEYELTKDLSIIQ